MCVVACPVCEYLIRACVSVSGLFVFNVCVCERVRSVCI